MKKFITKEKNLDPKLPKMVIEMFVHSGAPFHRAKLSKK
jgi:hypothetical protein